MDFFNFTTKASPTLSAVHRGVTMHIQHDYVIKLPFMDGIWGSGLVQVQSENSLRTTPEPHWTPKRFVVWPEGPNQTKFRFRVQRKLSPNQTAPDRGIPSNTTYTFIPGTLFNGTTPQLSYLELHKCTTSWKSPLLKGIRHLKIRLSSEHLRPSLSDWLDTLNCQELDGS